MSQNTLFNYFTRSPAPGTLKTNGSPSSNGVTTSKTPKRPSKNDSTTPKRTPKSSASNGSSKKGKIGDGSLKKTTTEKKKPYEQLGKLSLL